MKLRLARPAMLVDIGRLGDLSYVRDGGRPRRHRRAHPPPRPPATTRWSGSTARSLAHAPAWSATRRCATAARSAARWPTATRRRTCPAVCLALDADDRGAGPGGERTIDAGDFFKGFFETALAPTRSSPRSGCRRRGAAGW